MSKSFEENYPLVNKTIVDKFCHFQLDGDREHYIVYADADRDTLQFLLNEETSEEVAKTLKSLIAELS